MGKEPAVSSAKTFHTANELSPAAGMALDGKGRLFVSDEFNHRVIVYNPEFEIEHIIGSAGSGDGQFRYPRGLAIDGDGNLYVADAWNHRICVFGPDFAFKRNIGTLGEEAGELDEPVGVAFINGKLAVLEKSNHRVQIFNAEGRPLGSIGKRGSVDEQRQFYLNDVDPEIFSPPVFEFPSAIAADGAGNLYVADTNNHRVVKIDSKWEADSYFKLSGVRYPIGLACDDQNNLHLTEFNREGISVFSPEGILIYKYEPGAEVPVAITVSAGDVYVATGMKAGISLMAVDAGRAGGEVLENRFNFHFKKALAAYRDRRMDDFFQNLSSASDIDDRPDADDFAQLLPDRSFNIFLLRAAEEKSRTAQGFFDLIAGFSGDIWGEIDSALESKLKIADELIDINLKLEKSILAGNEDNDEIMVERFRAIKSLFNISSKIKRKFYAFKKLQEFQQKLSFAGLGVAKRLDLIANNLKRFTGWKEKREEWFKAAEKEAPSLSFASHPDERASFAKNESRLGQLGYEFRLFWQLASVQIHELAALVSNKEEELHSGKVRELVLSAIDFFVFCPEDLYSTRVYLSALDELFNALGEDRLASLVEGLGEKGHWESLGREDNIPRGVSGSAFRLLPSIWASASFKFAENIDPATWEKVIDFYHGEFRRYLAENTPLRTELVRNIQLHPMAEKGDPKQAAVVLRKIGLLSFHNYFQERYICGMIAEYLVRFSLLSLEKIPLPDLQVKRTAEELEKLADEITAMRVKTLEELSETDAKIKKIKDTGERNNIEVQRSLLGMSVWFYEYLCMALRIAKRRLTESGLREVSRMKSAKRLTYSGAAFAPLKRIISMEFGQDGMLFALAQMDGLILVFGSHGRLIRTFGGHGSMEGRLIKPMDITLTPDGHIIAAQRYNLLMSIFSQEGEFIRRFSLNGDKGRRPVCLQFDSKGRMFVSFLDGGGISIYNMKGELLGSINKKGTAFEFLEKVHGFAIKDDKLFAGGNGRIFKADLDGRELESVMDNEVDFGTIGRLCVDESGDTFAIDYQRNRILHVDSGFKAISRLDDSFTQGVGALAVKDGVVAVGDYVEGVVWTLCKD